MKRFFSNGGLSVWLTNRQIKWWIVSLGCLLGASYLVGRHFGFLFFLILATAGISIGSAVTAYLNWNRGKGTPAVLWMKNAPQITRTWNYRPKAINRRDASFESEGTGTVGIAGSSSSAPTENSDVWFDFITSEPKAKDAPSIAGPSEDAGKISGTTKVP